MAFLACFGKIAIFSIFKKFIKSFFILYFKIVLLNKSILSTLIEKINFHFLFSLIFAHYI